MPYLLILLYHKHNYLSTKTATPLYRNCGLCLEEKERLSRNAERSVALLQLRVLTFLALTELGRQNPSCCHSKNLPSSATVTRTPKTHFIRFGEPLGGGRFFSLSRLRRSRSNLSRQRKKDTVRCPFRCLRATKRCTKCVKND